MRSALILIPLIALTACGTPQERCIRSSTTELRRVETLLAEVEGNLARGYAWESYQTEVTRWEPCGPPPPPPPTKPGVKPPKPPKPQMCLRDHTVTRRRAVPIDPVVETRKRDNLLAKQRELTAQAAPQIAECKRLYPEEN